MERELKYLMPSDGTGDEILESRLVESAAVSDAEEISMRAIYYDTAGGALTSTKTVFRIRRENDELHAVVKSGDLRYGALHLRGEWEIETEDEQPNLEKFVSDIAGQPDAEAISLLLRPLATERLVPICGTEFVRIIRLLNVGGARFELCVDRGSLTRGAKRAPICELELELKSGNIEAMEEFGAALCDAYGLKTESRSKFKRAMAL